MWLNPQFPVDLVIFTEGILNGNFHFLFIENTCAKKTPGKTPETLTQVFSCEFCKVFKNTSFSEHLWTTTSVSKKKDFNWFHVPYNLRAYHCVNSVGISLRIQSECGKIRTRITPNTNTFHVVYCPVNPVAYRILYYHLIVNEIWTREDKSE